MRLEIRKSIKKNCTFIKNLLDSFHDYYQILIFFRYDNNFGIAFDFKLGLNRRA